MPKKKTPDLELCLYIDKEYPGQQLAKRYYVDEVITATENHRDKIGWLETLPPIGFQFEVKDFSWVRLNTNRKANYSLP